MKEPVTTEEHKNYSQDYCLEEAKTVVDYIIQQKVKFHCKHVKQWIINRVPLLHRTQLQF